MSLTGDTTMSLSEQKLTHAAEHRMERIREMYTEGRKFRVLKEGARLEAILMFGDTMAGWSRPLRVGQIIEVTGWKEGMGGGGFEELNFTTPGVPSQAIYCQVWPMSGLFRPWPMEGYLEPVLEQGQEVD